MVLVHNWLPALPDGPQDLAYLLPCVAKELLAEARAWLPRLKRVWADAAYGGQLVDWVKSRCRWILNILRRSDDAEGFEVLPGRWVVERTFAWFGKYRRLSKDYEYHPRCNEAMLHLAMTHLMVRRLARAATS